MALVPLNQRRPRSRRVAGLDSSLRALNRPGAKRHAPMPIPKPMALRSDGLMPGARRRAMGAAHKTGDQRTDDDGEHALHSRAHELA